MKPSRVPFRVLLPLLAVALWVVLIAIPATLAYIHLQQSAHGAAAVRLYSGQFEMTVRRSAFPL